MDFITNATLIAAAAVVLVHQLLKLKIVPVTFANRHPVPTNIILSIIAVVIIRWNDFASLHGWAQWLTEVTVVAVAAAVTYNQLLAPWDGLKQIEG